MIAYSVLLQQEGDKKDERLMRRGEGEQERMKKIEKMRESFLFTSQRSAMARTND
jgi:hypothetical protein